jgi:hypothetical protein
MECMVDVSTLRSHYEFFSNASHQPESITNPIHRGVEAYIYL